MASNPDEMKKRTKDFARRVISLVNLLPSKMACEVIGKQLLRSACSVGANYRAACRGRSKAEFIAKLGIVEEEADECVYWLELILAANLFPEAKLANLMTEANEITAIIVASLRTAKGLAAT
jgi:four helix bundle protein